MRLSQYLLILSLAVSPTIASGWSWSSSSTETETEQSDFVSPIINREIQVSVQAPWASSPSNVYCEAWSFLHEWEFLNALAVSPPADNFDDFESATKRAVDIASNALPDSNHKLLHYSLTMRAKSPACEMQRSLATQYNLNGDFCVINGEAVVQDVADLPAAIPRLPDVELASLKLPGEDPHPTSKPSSGLVVLYTNFGSPNFGSWYEQLVAKDLPFVVRYSGHGILESPSTTLQGYGVRLDIRNVEYKVFDDRQDQAEEEALVNATEVSSDVPDFLGGVNISALASEVSSDLQAELWKIHEAQTQHSQLIPPTWQRRKLSLQAASVIAGAAGDNALVTLEQVSQNLPSLASTLVHVEVPEKISDAAEKIGEELRELIRESGGGFWINGKPLNVVRSSFNIFEMIQLLQDEAKQLQRFEGKFSQHFEKQEALEQVQIAWSKGEQFFQGQQVGGVESVSDHRRIDVASGEKDAVIYLNNVERDPQYADWPTSMQQMMMMMQYGMSPSVRRNLITILAVDDPMEKQEETAWGKALFYQLAQSNFPARMGKLIVDAHDVKVCEYWVKTNKPGPDEPCPTIKSWLDTGDIPDTLSKMEHAKAEARDVYRCYLYMAKKYKGRSDIFIKYDQMFGPTLRGNVSRGYTSLYILLNVHAGILQDLGLVGEKDPIMKVAKEVLEVTKDDGYGKVVRFAVEKGLRPGMSFLNGRPMPDVGEKDARENVSKLVMEEQEEIFGMIYNGEITDTQPRNFYRSMLVGKNKKNVFPRVHPLLTGSADNLIDLDIDNASSSFYLKPESDLAGSKADAVFSVDAFFDLRKSVGLSLAHQFLTMMKDFQSSIDETSVSVAYRIIPSKSTFTDASLCKLVASAKSLGSDKMMDAFNSLVQGKSASDVVASLDVDESAGCLELLPEDLPADNFLVANGRYFEIDGDSVAQIDVELLMRTSMAETKAVSSMLRPYVSSDYPHSAVASTTAFLMASKSQDRSNPSDAIDDLEQRSDLTKNPLRFTWDGDSGSAALKTRVLAIVDPVTETAQRVSSLLKTVRDDLGLSTTLVLAPQMLLESGSKVPISSYYRFVTDSSAYQGGENSPLAHFSNLPTNHILTVRMDVAEPWDIQQRKAIQDTDNLRCDLKSGCSDHAALGTTPDGVPMYEQRHLTEVEFNLNHLLFFGQCYQVNNGVQPPNGLQLTLSRQYEEQNEQLQEVQLEADGSISAQGVDVGTREVGIYSDTLVMKNVGYWQLPANPGVWDMKIDENSRGSEIFDIVAGTISPHGAVKLTDSRLNNHTERLVMGDFVTSSETLLVKRRKGYESTTLFHDKTDEDSEDVINVFSLATGHLYERLLKIMMLSVTKRTSSKVKFWLFENFLSPTFKASAISMAEKIGCEVEFVTYKWPQWLRGQSEKQRIIWGYKILFLDVLFPLGVKKIIYVDADQVVRGDLKELWDMDLEGAPYGYTPMCSSRESTLGFQFWRSGFWEQHLRGKPYHISALYVVDLERFRRDLVGDQLRSVYQQLSADPNSLANLDQDLPNYAQHSVPIFSLPQEWLWCESWCSDETKPDAKTIDLCNNPLHKEPKLSMAKRVISGELFEESWEELDAEVGKYDKEFFETN
ncbi:unnamed protein product [Cylindrotheca closterium]|uniref:UDP-glucose:glycoprotein glucosyltransferase n=1 Tax=Cylindrotheca closterium TaxID=2856 RepID=A0AAD2JK50_9STRA|nr:unnamed protein product [Cylindrotheca closterium]